MSWVLTRIKSDTTKYAKLQIDSAYYILLFSKQNSNRHTSQCLSINHARAPYLFIEMEQSNS